MLTRCRQCEEPTDGRKHCGYTCYLKSLPATDTPLRSWRLMTGISMMALAGELGIPYETMRRYAAGYPMAGTIGSRAIEVCERMAGELEARGIQVNRFELLCQLLRGTQGPEDTVHG